MRTKRKLCNFIILYVLIGIVSIIALFPAVYGVFVSFKPNRELFIWPPTILPNQWTLKAYNFIFSQKEYIRHFMNSWIICIMASFLSIVLGSLAGYGFSRFNFWGKRILLLGTLSLIMFPGPVLMIPYFKMSKALNLYDTYTILILVNSAFWLPISIWLFKNFFASLPFSIE